jgi:hypothetical protein
MIILTIIVIQIPYSMRTISDLKKAVPHLHLTNFHVATT